MHKGMLSAERNHKGTLVLSISAQGGSPLPVPKSGRCADELFLKYHNQEVSFQRNEAGTMTHIQAGKDILFGSAANVIPPKMDAPTSHKPTPASQQPSSGGVQNISQQRAKHALEAVQTWMSKDNSEQKELKSYACDFPAMILMSGFGQACAFYLSNSKENHKVQFDLLAQWLHKQQVFQSSDLMCEITQCDQNTYQIAQAEALEYLGWVKKFAKAYLQGDDDESTAS